MPRFTLLLVLFCTSILNGCKKDLLNLRQVTPLTSHTTSRLNNIRFLNDDVCIAAGGSMFLSSVMLRSVDGGYTWAADSSLAAPKELFGLGAGPDGAVYLSGVDGCVLKSADKGVSWQFHRIDNWEVYKAGTFSDPDTGIFVSTILQRQSSIVRVDSSFKIIDEQVFQFGLNNLYMVSPSVGFAIGYGVVMKTTDKGATWNYLNVNGDNFTAMDIHGKEMWLCGANGSIFHTYDNGVIWERQRNGNDLALARYLLRTILFTDRLNGWAGGDKGVLLHTTDGGSHWAQYDKFTSSTIRSIAYCPNGDLLVAGDDGALFRIQP